jgi:putative membrane-bound dehydrogenase-like protein
MKTLLTPLAWIGCILFAIGLAGKPGGVALLAQDKAPQTGPETEKRFPPLKMAPGFKATLFACDPLIEYPSAVALGPRPGSIFLAVDYMTGLGTEIIRRDEIRLVEDTNRDGYADRTVVYAGEFNSIQGLTFHDGMVYAMHSPFLTALRDADGDGKADERRDLVTGLGLAPAKNPVRLHCANGIIMGHDGWLYLALGDQGCDVTRVEGDRLVLQGGGILRCRPDGRDLHVFATGLRNIYDVALDDELNVFVRDNENDGGDYKIRVCHSFFGADHGYPYLYYERPQEALRPLADLGLGSSAGGLCYLETAFPAEYRGNLFFCEWGRSVVRYPLERSGSSFAPVKELEFAAGAESDPYGFKPTDLVVERDGSLIVVDWADGQRPKRGRGRIYRISPVAGPNRPAGSDPSPSEPGEITSKASELEHWITQLNSDSYYERIDAQTAVERKGRKGLLKLNEALQQRKVGVRGRLHAMWILAHLNGQSAVEDLLKFAETDPEPRVRAQAVRAVSDLADPAMIRHRLDAGADDGTLGAKLASLVTREHDRRVILEVIVALGRLRWAGAPAWLRDTVGNINSSESHAAMQTMRRSQNWPAVLKLLDEADTLPIRSVALQALAERVQPAVVDGLIDRLPGEKNPVRRREYADLLTRVHKKPGPWVYWGYRPPPRPANTVAWERTDAIEQALNRVLTDADRTIRLAVLRRMQREKIPAQPATLDYWLREEREADCVAAILEALRDHSPERVRRALAEVIAGRDHAMTNRLAALARFAGGLDALSAFQLLDLAGALEDGPVLGETLRQLGKHPQPSGSTLLLAKSDSPEPIVRASAIEALAELGVTAANDSVRRHLEDTDARVRLAAASAVGRLRVPSASASLLNLAQETDPALRRASLNSLRLLKEPRVVPLAVSAMKDRETQAAALECIKDLGGPEQLQAVVDLALRDPSAEVLLFVVQLLTKWSLELPPAKRPELDRVVAELQGASGILLRWRTDGPLSADTAAEIVRPFASGEKLSLELNENVSNLRTLFATGAESRVALGSGKGSGEPTVWLAFTAIQVSEPMAVQFLASSRGALRIWLNTRVAYQRDESRAFAPDSDRFEGALTAGANVVMVQVSSPDLAEFHLRFRRKSSTAAHEQLTQAALTRSGSVERGRKLFLDAEKTQCLKCHRLLGQGEQVGPELTGIGGRFSRIHIIESILEPSRTVGPGFQTVEIGLRDGRELSGILIGEKDGAVTLADSQGKKHVFARSQVDAQRTQSLSAMPEGLEKVLTTENFIDLIAFLVSQKETQAR